MKKVVIDTNALLLHLNSIDFENEIIIPEIVLHELDRLKIGVNDTAYHARQAIRKLKSLNGIYYDHDFGKSHPASALSNDDVIVQCAKSHGAHLLTGDFLAQLKAKSLGVQVVETDSSEDAYSGYVEVVLNDCEIAQFYENLGNNQFGLLQNQYLIIKDKHNTVIETARWDGNEFHYVRQKGFQTNMFGKFKPFDEHQVCALDSLERNKLTMLKGKAGSGKSLIALNYAWNQIERGKYDQLIVFTNPVASKNSARLGFYPGTRDEKLLNSQTGTMLSSKFGDIMEVQKQISYGKLVLLPFADIRGFDSTGLRAIIWIIESQNLDIELMRTGITRIGNDCKAILDGDNNGQVDMDEYAGFNNGMRRVSEVFRGLPFYGEVELKNVHRSEMAKYADLL
ncbi:PhoH-like protein [compost metagenome]